MTTTSIFDVNVQLLRYTLIRLLRGEVVDASGHPPGMTMIKANVHVRLEREQLKESERLAIIDLLTRDADDMKAGFHFGKWSDSKPVVGTSEWLVMIASNADRIMVRAKDRDHPGRFIDLPLAELSPVEQKATIRQWLESDYTPEWQSFDPTNAYGQSATLGDAAVSGLTAAIAHSEEVEKKVLQAQRDSFYYVTWLRAETAKIGRHLAISPAEDEFLSSISQRLSRNQTMTDKQAKWFKDILTKAKQKAASMASLLPPPPRLP